MGHKFGYIVCKKNTASDFSGVDIDLERGESTPLLNKYHQEPMMSGKQRCDSSFILLSCILIVGSLIGLYLLFEQERTLKFNVPFFMIERSVLNYAAPRAFLLNAASSTTSINYANGIVFLNTRFPSCSTKQMCTEIIKSLIGLGVSMQQLNFLIGGDGHVYEMSGWDYPSKLEETFQEKKVITVGFMGDFTNQTPPKLMFDVAKALISESIRRRRLNASYSMFGMRNNSGMDGEALYQQLADWPHWKNVIDLEV